MPPITAFPIPTAPFNPITQLNGGINASALTFWRGDGTWSVPPTGAAGANPTATAGPAAINGVATSFMRSDAAPAVQTASMSQLGIVKPDGVTVGISSGVLSAIGSGGASPGNPTATAGPSAINGSAVTFMRSDAAPAIQLGTATQKGLLQVDGTTIIASSGIISATGSITYPLLAPNGSISAPSYSWVNDTNSGFYRFGSHDIRISINGVDCFRYAPNLADNGFGVVIADQTTFFYPTGTGGGPAHGLTIKTNRIQVGVEALQGTQGVQSPVSWVNIYQPGAMELASVGVTSQIGGMPIVAATRTSDFHTAITGDTGGAGSYFFALNDDTTVALGGEPIASALNATVWRASGVTGVSEAIQTDAENLGTVVDNDPYTAYTPGTTIGQNITCGAFSNSTNQATVALIFGTGGGTNAKFRKGIICTQGALDPSLGGGANGLFAELPRGVSVRWTNSGHTADAEIWGAANGFFVSPSMVVAEIFGGTAANSTLLLASTTAAGIADAIEFFTGSQVKRLVIDTNGNTQSQGTLGYGPAGSGVGGSVTQTTSITTAVTLNKICGTIITVSNSFIAGTAVQFTVNDSLVAATDVVIASLQNANGMVSVNSISAGSFVIALFPLVTAVSVVVINFAVIKSVNT